MVKQVETLIVITASWEIIQHSNKLIDAKKEFQMHTINSMLMARHMRSLSAVRSKDMDQTKQIFGIILSLLILPTNAYAHTIEYEHGYKAALNDTLAALLALLLHCVSKPVVPYIIPHSKWLRLLLKGLIQLIPAFPVFHRIRA